MTTPVRYRSEITAELVARAAPELEELFAWWSDRVREAAEERRRIRPELLRWLGLGVSLLGIAVAAFAIVITPDAPPCRPGNRLLFYNAVMPFFVVCATVFGFLPRIRPGIQAWVRRMGARQARRFAERLGRAAPYTAEYDVSEGRITARVEKQKLVSFTELRRVERARFGRDVALLHGGSFPRWVKRIVWLPEDAAARRDLREALAAAGVVVTDLPAAPTGGGA